PPVVCHWFDPPFCLVWPMATVIAVSAREDRRRSRRSLARSVHQTCNFCANCLHGLPALATMPAGLDGSVALRRAGMIYVFGACELDIQRHVLTRAGQPVHLR